jgi:hypothetical protein
MKYPEDPGTCVLERETAEEMNVTTPCMFYGDLMSEWELIEDAALTVFSKVSL